MKFDPKGWWSNTRDYVREVSSEMNKVTWPSRPEVIGTTGVVLATVVFFGLYLWLSDLVFYRAIDFVFTQLGAGA
ncbi:MAG TPA: preprotein translocase subunit SecE [Thermoanaerobaculia bacterium]|nr:preprotein translocase subunit SecE [Thermoanaerobaculia bacterium]